MHFEAAEKMHPFLRPFVQVTRGLATILGDDCELVLYDVGVLEHSVVACANGHITGRAIGSPMTGYGLELVNSADRHRNGTHVYMARTDGGVLIKSGVIFLRDEREKLVGLLCVHFDTAKAVQAKRLIDQFFSAGINGGEHDPINEYYGLELEEVFRNMIAESETALGRDLYMLTKAEKMEIVRDLANKGFFMMKGAVDFLAGEMHNSKFTIYAYIREVEKTDA